MPAETPGSDPIAILGRLCRYRWDTQVLISLHQAGRPMRRSDLTREVTRREGERISDTQMSRTLDRLAARRRIIREVDHGRAWCRLTLTGRDEAAKVRQLIDRLRGDSAHPGRAETSRPTRPVDTRPYAITATRWSSDLLATGPVPLTPPERAHLLTDLARRLESALATADPPAVRAVGAELITAGYVSPEALGRTIAMMTTPLVQHQTGPAARVPQLVAQLAIGWAEAARKRALEAQELLRNAAISAHDQAAAHCQ
ncbi:MAG: hypothetical protein ACRDT2_20380 [Natronosporangium sp.]